MPAQIIALSRSRLDGDGEMCTVDDRLAVSEGAAPASTGEPQPVRRARSILEILSTTTTDMRDGFWVGALRVQCSEQVRFRLARLPDIFHPTLDVYSVGSARPVTDRHGRLVQLELGVQCRESERERIGSLLDDRLDELVLDSGSGAAGALQ